MLTSSYDDGLVSPRNASPFRGGARRAASGLSARLHFGRLVPFPTRRGDIAVVVAAGREGMADILDDSARSRPVTLDREIDDAIGRVTARYVVERLLRAGGDGDGSLVAGALPET